ncbi:MAG: hypothetical protein ACKO0U_00115 [Gammaproteobacteria bacterium]
MTDRAACLCEEAPLRPVHIRGTVARFGGVFGDGGQLGIVGMALGAARSLRWGVGFPLASETRRQQLTTVPDHAS